MKMLIVLFGSKVTNPVRGTLGPTGFLGVWLGMKKKHLTSTNKEASVC